MPSRDGRNQVIAVFTQKSQPRASVVCGALTCGTADWSGCRVVTECEWEGQPVLWCPGCYEKVDGVLVENTDLRRTMVPFNVLVETVRLRAPVSSK